MNRRTLLAAGVALGAATAVSGVRAAPREKPAVGRPVVHLNALTLPAGLPDAAGLERRLRATLHREARRASWGAGRDNRIEYRFSLVALDVSQHGSVLRVHCAAVGRLPGGETAKSDITFGGAPAERTALVHRVVDVTARGVVARLAELERARRGLR